MTYEVRLANGDSAEAEDIGGAMLAARTLCIDAAQTHYGVARLHRREVIVLRDGRYDGAATQMARAS